MQNGQKTARHVIHSLLFKMFLMISLKITFSSNFYSVYQKQNPKLVVRIHVD